MFTKYSTLKQESHFFNISLPVDEEHSNDEYECEAVQRHRLGMCLQLRSTLDDRFHLARKLSEKTFLKFLKTLKTIYFCQICRFSHSIHSTKNDYVRTFLGLGLHNVAQDIHPALWSQ